MPEVLLLEELSLPPPLLLPPLPTPLHQLQLLPLPQQLLLHQPLPLPLLLPMVAMLVLRDLALLLLD